MNNLDSFFAQLDKEEAQEVAFSWYRNDSARAAQEREEQTERIKREIAFRIVRQRWNTKLDEQIAQEQQDLTAEYVRPSAGRILTGTEDFEDYKTQQELQRQFEQYITASRRPDMYVNNARRAYRVTELVTTRTAEERLAQATAGLDVLYKSKNLLEDLHRISRTIGNHKGDQSSLGRALGCLQHMILMADARRAKCLEARAQSVRKEHS